MLFRIPSRKCRENAESNQQCKYLLLNIIGWRCKSIFYEIYSTSIWTFSSQKIGDFFIYFFEKDFFHIKIYTFKFVLLFLRFVSYYFILLFLLCFATPVLITTSLNVFITTGKTRKSCFSSLSWGIEKKLWSQDFFKKYILSY